MKVGKTTLLSQLPKSLICAFEPGTNALNNAYVQPIETWADFKRLVRQLKVDEVKEKFEFIGIDTADVAYDLCVKYICEQENVDSLSGIAWGRGYDMATKEFSETFRTIALLGYGLCFVSHSAEKTFKNEKGEDYVQLCPALPPRPYNIINKMVDIIGYIRPVKQEDGEYKTYMFFRGNDAFLAGSRFKYIVPRIEFSYENLVGAIYNAIDKQVSEDGNADKVNNEYNSFYQENKRSFDEIMNEARDTWGQLVKKNPKNAEKVLEIVERALGQKMKISEITEDNQEKLEIILEEMLELLDK